MAPFIRWIVAVAAGVLACGSAHAALLQYRIFTLPPPGGFTEFFQSGAATTALTLGPVTVPGQAQLAPGDIVQVDLFAPAGLFYEITPPAGATQTQVRFSVGNSLVVGGPLTVAAQSASIAGQTLGGAVTTGGRFVYSNANNEWFAEGIFTFAGAQTFSALSVQFVVPAGGSLSVQPLTSLASSSVTIANDPGSTWVRLVEARTVPEPPTALLALTALGAIVIGTRRRRSAS